MDEQEDKKPRAEKTAAQKFAEALAKKIEGESQTAPPAVDKPLTPEDIRKLPGETRAHLAVAEINETLKKFNCIYDPILHLSNNGHHIEVKVVGLAFAGPEAFFLPPTTDPRWN